MILNRRRKPNDSASRSRRFQFERLESRELLAFGVLPQNTMDYMLGDVVVTPVFFESVGAASTEDWTPELIAETKAKIQEGLDWWVTSLSQVNSVHSLNFIVDWTHADSPVETDLEPIDGRSQDYSKWGYDFLELVGFEEPVSQASTQMQADIREFNHSQREKHDGDWAFTILVANSENDPDDSWNGVGSAFSRAFAFSGGRMIVLPSGRPASTVAHEVGHQAWALDEYDFGNSTPFHYLEERGYLNVQNVNAFDNPDPDYVREPSIMERGSILEFAYANFTSSTSSLGMIGWQDSDDNGVFDILDVPHLLEGSGRPDGDEYRFVGRAEVQTLANMNSNLFSDIPWVSDSTLNTIDRVDYRIDGGDWVTLTNVQNLGGPTALLDLTIPLGDTDPHLVDIRTVTVDSGTGRIVTTSPVFSGSTSTHDGAPGQGISGFVYEDAAENQQLDGVDRGLPGWTVQLTDDQGELLDLKTVADPDAFNNGDVITTQFEGVTLLAQGTSVSSHNIKALRPGGATSTGSGVFGFNFTPTITSSVWSEYAFEMRMDFDSPVTRVSIDAVSQIDPGYGRLEIYNSSNELIGRYTTELLNDGDVETMVLERGEGDIAYAVAFGHADTFIRLDNLQFGVDATTTTDAQGYYHFASMPAGDYFVQTVAPAAVFEDISPNTVEVNLGQGQEVSHVDFGKRNLAVWHNAPQPPDVDGNGRTNLLDAFTVIEAIRNRGLGALPEANDTTPRMYFDVNANNRLDLVDAFATIDAVRNQQNGGSGEGEGGGQNDTSGGGNQGQGQPPQGEGEGLTLAFRSTSPLPSTTNTLAARQDTNSAPLTAIPELNTEREDVEWWRIRPVNEATSAREDADDEKRNTANEPPAKDLDPASRSDASADLWRIRDLDEVALEDAVDAISADVDSRWNGSDPAEESAKVELRES